jgi:hypothetical protein
MRLLSALALPVVLHAPHPSLLLLPPLVAAAHVMHVLPLVLAVAARIVGIGSEGGRVIVRVVDRHRNVAHAHVVARIVAIDDADLVEASHGAVAPDLDPIRAPAPALAAVIGRVDALAAVVAVRAAAEIRELQKAWGGMFELHRRSLVSVDAVEIGRQIDAGVDFRRTQTINIKLTELFQNQLL